jgi:poly-gamma-glutamate synthesis protein (capsule biosynthesis protein)
MKTILLLFLVSSSLLLAEFRSSIQDVSKTPKIKNRMLKGGSWKKGCPVPLKDLRYIRVSHYDFNGSIRQGELVMHKDVAKEVVAIFRELYAMRYPIKQMRLISDAEFSSSDYRSIEADNTSAFNCRNVTGGSKWSKHAYGLAIDINPIENPYYKVGRHSSHTKSRPYEKRAHKARTTSQGRALLLRGDKVTQVFLKRGWNWGGDWKYTKDYQHFQKVLHPPHKQRTRVKKASRPQRGNGVATKKISHHQKHQAGEKKLSHSPKGHKEKTKQDNSFVDWVKKNAAPAFGLD